MGANDKVAATFHPMQVLEVRFEAETPDDAIELVLESVQAEGLSIGFIREIPASITPVVQTGDPKS